MSTDQDILKHCIQLNILDKHPLLNFLLVLADPHGLPGLGFITAVTILNQTGTTENDNHTLNV